jgi:hypothetical protein
MNDLHALRARRGTLSRAAGIVVALAWVGLSACAAAPDMNMSGSSTPPGTWTHTTNEPNWRSPSYATGP